MPSKYGFNTDDDRKELAHEMEIERTRIDPIITAILDDYLESLPQATKSPDQSTRLVRNGWSLNFGVRGYATISIFRHEFDNTLRLEIFSDESDNFSWDRVPKGMKLQEKINLGKVLHSETGLLVRVSRAGLFTRDFWV